MSSIDVTRGGLRPWQFFVASSVVAATAAMLLARETHPAALVLISVAIWTAGLVGFTVYRTLSPLVVGESARWRAQRTSGAHTALEREKQLVLRSIKELEFDRAMGKVADRDFDDMLTRLRTRALGLMQQLDALNERGDTSVTVRRERSVYRAAIERDLAELLGPESDPPETIDRVPPPSSARACRECRTPNDADARFCKACGQTL